MTKSEIVAMQTAAGQAGDIVQAAVCAVALGEVDISDYPMSDEDAARVAAMSHADALAECERVSVR